MYFCVVFDVDVGFVVVFDNFNRVIGCILFYCLVGDYLLVVYVGLFDGVVRFNVLKLEYIVIFEVVIVFCFGYFVGRD